MPCSQTYLRTASHPTPISPLIDAIFYLRDNIRYDLLRTGNVELTSNKILERGFLDAVCTLSSSVFCMTNSTELNRQPPPAYFTIYPRSPVAQTQFTATGTNVSSSSKPKPVQSLISRYNLEGRTASDEGNNILGGGKAVWEDSSEKREASLRERKAQMILAAREYVLVLSFLWDPELTWCAWCRRMLKQQAKSSSNS